MSSVFFVVWVSDNSRLTVASGVSSGQVLMEERSERQACPVGGVLNPEAEHVSDSITSESFTRLLFPLRGTVEPFFCVVLTGTFRFQGHVQPDARGSTCSPECFCCSVAAVCFLSAQKEFIYEIGNFIH